MGNEADELEAEEPRTPMWLPLLGGGLFLLALLIFLAMRSDPEPPPADSAAAEAPAETDPAETDPAETKE